MNKKLLSIEMQNEIDDIEKKRKKGFKILIFVLGFLLVFCAVSFILSEVVNEVFMYIGFAGGFLVLLDIIVIIIWEEKINKRIFAIVLGKRK